MDRVYMNRIPGQRRIHIEIDEAEIPELLTELAAPASTQGQQLAELLAAAQRRFEGRPE